MKDVVILFHWQWSPVRDVMFIELGSKNNLSSSVGAKHLRLRVENFAPTELVIEISVCSYKHHAPTELLSRDFAHCLNQSLNLFVARVACATHPYQAFWRQTQPLNY